MKRIAINALSARSGGGQTYIWNLFLHLPKEIDFKIFLFISPSKKMSFLNKRNDIKLIYVKDRGPLFRIIWENTILPFYLLYNKIDLIFFPGGTVPIINIKNIKLVTMFRNMIPFDKKELSKYEFSLSYIRNIMLSFILKKSMKKADSVIFISKFGMRFIKSVTKNKIKKCELIYHGVSEYLKKIKNDEINIKNFNNYILYPSMIHYYKNQIEVFKAYENFIREFPRGPDLIFAGKGDDNYLRKLKFIVNNSKISDKVFILENVPFKSMPVFYRNASFIVFASMSENCPNILLESLSFGKAILCSKKFPMPEFGGKNVVYFDGNSIDELSSKLKLFFKNPNIVRTYEKKALVHSKNFDGKISALKTWNYLVYNATK